MGALQDSIGVGSGGVTVRETDGTPSIVASIIEFPNGSLSGSTGATAKVDQYPAPAGIDGPNLNAFAGNLRAGWTFNDAGAPIDDSVGVNYQLALQSGSPGYLQTGKNGTSVGLAGAIFSRPSAGWSPGTGSWTINAWVYQTAYGSYPIFFRWYNGTSTSHTLYLRNNGQVTWLATSAVYAEIGSFISYLNKWTMITWKRTFTAPSTYLHEVYLDGAFFASYDNAALPDDLNTYSLEIGGNGSVHKQDEVLFYTEAISAAAIAELYNSGTGLFLTTIGAPNGLGFSHADLVGYNSNLHSYWKCEESGSPLIDSIGNNSLAATGNPTYSVAGKDNNCVEMDGSGDYFSRIGSFLHKADQQFSLSLWINPDVVSGSDYVLDFFINSNDRTALTLASSNLNLVRIQGGVTRTSIAGAITASTWHHVVITKEISGATYTTSLWLDNVLIGSDSTSTGATYIDASTGTFSVGRYSGGSGFDYDGKVDEIAYYKGAALDANAVAALYNAGAGRFLESV